MKSFKGLAATVAASNKKAKGEDERSPSRSGAAALGSTKIGALMNKLLHDKAASVAASLGGERKTQKLVIWPEWSDADINAEKWDALHKGKDKDKGKSPIQHLFDDPEGRIELPPILKVHQWARPLDFIAEKTPVVVDLEALAVNNGEFDLLSMNEQVYESELMRWITSQINALWRLAAVKGAIPGNVDAGTPGGEEDDGRSWHPWEHIYAINKVGKGPNVPVYNPYGKYAVKLYWMGCWRKLIVDDSMPFDDSGRLLLPATTLQHELWPMLLAKALIKVASLDYAPPNSSSEFIDFSVINCLTGWLPETIPLQYGHTKSIWELLKASLTEWKLPEPETTDLTDAEDGRKTLTSQDGGRLTQAEQERSKTASERPDPKSAKSKDKAKDDKKKDKSKEKSLQDEPVPPSGPEIICFAAFNHPPKYPVRVSALAEMADASECLRQNSISHMYPHPVFITQTRSCPLEPPPPPEIIPLWKQIRPRKKKVPPTDEPVPEPEPEKPIQCVSLTSPFINYKVSSVPIPRDTHRPASALERGSTTTPSPAVPAIEETDENAPEIDEDQQKQMEEINAAAEAEKVDEPLHLEKKSPNREKSDKTDKEDKKLSASSKDKPGKSRRGSQSSSIEKTSNRGYEGKSIGDPSIIVTEAPKSETNEEGAAPTEFSASEQEELAEKAEALSKEIWMDFDHFCKCFKTLYIFHKPNTYNYNHKQQDLRIQSAGASSSSSKEKKSAPNTAAGLPVDDKSPYYMFVDSLQSTEIVVSLSGLCRWNDPVPIKDESRANTRSRADQSRADQSRADNVTTDSSSVIEAITEPRTHDPVTPAFLTAEPYTWKRLTTGQPILRLRTTATKSAVLTLPEGRHVLRFNISAPLGYFVHLCSSTNLVFGDEEKVMAELQKESCRFVDTALKIMGGLGKALNCFNEESFTEAYEELCDLHCPYRKNRHLSKIKHFQIFNQSVYGLLKQILPEANLATPEMALAWRTFFFDCNTPNILGLPPANRPVTGATSDRGSAKKGSKRTSAPPEPAGEPQDPKLEQWSKGIAEPEELTAAVKIQRTQRAHAVRKIAQARKPGNADNVKMHEQLQKAWTIIEPKLEEHGLQLLRLMFKADSSLMQHYTFHKDEWNRISYADYQGTYIDQSPNQWFIVFRDIFYVEDDMLCVPKIYVPIATCMLRVINNDTNEEVPRVFQKVAPYVYKKNKRGYTFVAEARTLEYPVVANKWKMRLIASLSQMPAPAKAEVNCAFQSHEIRNYYVPNEKNLILRYTVNVQEDHLVSIQMNTSKADVYIRLAVMDHDQEVISIVGKGHVVIPSYIFLKDQVIDEETGSLKRSGSRSSLRGKGSHSAANKGKRGTSGERRESRGSRRQSMCGSEIDGEEPKVHKYYIQAHVLRNSWPLSESNWIFVQGLKEIEKNEMKLSYKERAPSPPRDKLPSAASHKGKDKEKGAKGKGGKGDKEKQSSRPPSTQFEHGKAHWILRVVSDQAAAENIEIKKDTERADEIRAMKKAWEEAEPGRAARGMKSRQDFIKSRLIQVSAEDDEAPKDEEQPETEGGTSELATTTDQAASPTPASITLDVIDTETVLTLEPPPLPPPKEILEPFDETPFLRRITGVPRLRDEEEIQRQTEEKQRKIAEYKAYREQVEAEREQDRINRNQTKLKQIELCELMQARLDHMREELNKPREAYRQKLIEAERLRQEAIAEQEAALRAEQERNAPSPKGGRKSAKGKKGSAGKKKK